MNNCFCNLFSDNWIWIIIIALILLSCALRLPLAMFFASRLTRDNEAAPRALLSYMTHAVGHSFSSAANALRTVASPILRRAK